MTQSGVNALDCIDSPPVSAETLQCALITLEANYGAEYSKEKMVGLFNIIRAEEWSEARFSRTLLWFLKNKPFPAWTIADWFQYECKLYPIEWYHNEQHKAGIYVNVMKSMDVYELPNGERGYRYCDGQELPFRKIR